MPVITINSLNLEIAPSANQTYHVKWRLASDPDVSGSYTNAPDIIVNTSGGIVSPSPYQITVPTNNIYINIVNSCNSNTFSKEYYIDECCEQGYMFTEDGAQCSMIDEQTATYIGGSSPITVCHYTNSIYSQYGSLFYKLNGYNIDGTYNTGNTPSAALTTANAGGSYAGVIWGNPSNNTTDGRLNKTALWSCSDPNYTGVIGFGFQISVPTSGTYYVGFGADNSAKLIIDGITIIDQSSAAIGTQLCGGSSHIECVFKYWHVYPVALTAGIHLISATGNNTSSVGAFGCEIYNASESVLSTCTSASGTNGDTSLATTNLHRYIVFSTKDITDNTLSDSGNYTCSTGYTLIKDSNGDYSCQKVLYDDPVICDASKVGMLIAPLSSSIAIAPIYESLKYLRCEKNVNSSTNNTYQSFSNAGYKVVLTLNSAPSVSGNQTAFPTGSDLTTYTTNINSFLTSNPYNFNLLCIQNEENNQGYWNLSDPSAAATAYLNMLQVAITAAHNNGYLISNGGLTGPSLKWMVWKDILDRQGSTAATTFANKVFDSGQVSNLSSFPSQPTYQNTIAFCQAVIPMYASMNLDFINFHWYEPSHDQILSNTSIDPSAILTVVNYLERVTGKRAICNELGQHNTADNILPQLLDTLMNIHMPYILMYDGDGAAAGSGDAYAFHNTDNTIRTNGVAIRNFLKTHQ